MRFRLLFAMLVFFSLIRSAYAVQSTITEGEGYSCMGDDKSRKQTEQAAMNDAKKMPQSTPLRISRAKRG